MKDNEKNFYTVRGYALLQHDTSLTPSMEDYLEMIYRLSKERGFTRVNDLASALNVQPPSASKMVQKLAEMEYLKYQKYGIIELTPKGLELGCYLLKRHETVEQFLKLLGVKENILEETEKIEHNISESTLEQLEILVRFMKENQQWRKLFSQYQREK